MKRVRKAPPKRHLEPQARPQGAPRQLSTRAAIVTAACATSGDKWHPGVCEQKWKDIETATASPAPPLSTSPRRAATGNPGTSSTVSRHPSGYCRLAPGGRRRRRGRCRYSCVAEAPQGRAAWPAGEFATLATKHSEADPVAVMMTSLTAIGALLGRARFIRIGDTEHHSRRSGPSRGSRRTA